MSIRWNKHSYQFPTFKTGALSTPFPVLSYASYEVFRQRGSTGDCIDACRAWMTLVLDPRAEKVEESTKSHAELAYRSAVGRFSVALWRNMSKDRLAHPKRSTTCVDAMCIDAIKTLFPQHGDPQPVVDIFDLSRFCGVKPRIEQGLRACSDVCAHYAYPR